MIRRVITPFHIVAVVLVAVAATALGFHDQWVVAGKREEQRPLFLPAMMNDLELTSLTLRLEIAGIGSDTPVAITHAGDSRLFVATQAGRIYVIQRDPVTFEPVAMSVFLDLVGQVNFSFEEGLLGLVFHPDYVHNGHFYITYNEFATGKIVLARYLVSADPNLADPGSRLIMMAIDKPPNALGAWPPYSPVHNGGDLHFGADGYLYMATGDGGPDPYELGPPYPGDPYNHGQRLDVLLGKILRIDVNQQTPLPPNCGGVGYTIPADNPFADGSGGFCDEIWSYGWRNPWRFSFDPLTGHMYIADVGERLLEEVNFEPAGAGGRNYGWHCFEGTVDFRNEPHLAGTCSEDDNLYTEPFYVWDHSLGCSAIGGYVYRSNNWPTMRGHYFFADFCSRLIWAADTENLAGTVWIPPMTIENTSGPPQWTALGTDVRGEIYIGAYYHNAIYHITAP